MIKEIKKYITNCSTKAIRNRANSIQVNLKFKTKEKYVFYYKGSGNKPYEIIVFFKEKNIKTSCNCPYDYAGLCKHEVAGLNFIIDEEMLEKIQKDLFGNEIIEVKNDELFLENHLITDVLLDSICKKNNIYYLQEYSIEILAITKNFIKTTYNSWPSKNQEFNYNSTNNILKVFCTCRESKKNICVHILSALSRLIEDFGEDFFTPNYIDNQKELFLKNYGLTLADNYKDFFDFSFGINGIEVVEKVKNIVPSLEMASSNLIPKLDKKQEDAFLISSENKSQELEYGIGFCFDLYRQNKIDFFSFLPFKAKFKKHSKEFASTFKEIDRYNFVEQLRTISVLEKNALLQAIEFREIYERFLNNFSIDMYRSSFIQFNNLLKETSEYSYFTKKKKDTFVKKNIVPVNFSSENPILSFTFTEKEALYTLKPKITIEGNSYQINSSKIKIFPFFCLYNNTIYCFKTPQEFLHINRLQQRSEINFIKNDENKLYEEFLKPISKHFDITTKVYKVSKKKIAEEQLQKQVYLSDYEGEYILFKLGVQYNKEVMLLHTKEQLFDAKKQRIIPRNYTFENEFLEEFKEFHPDFKEQDGVFFLTPYQLVEDGWLLKFSEKMPQKNIAIFGAKELKSFKFNLNKPTISMSVKSETDWFDLNIEIKYGNQKVSLRDIKKAVLKKSKYVVLGDGTFGILPKEWLQKFSRYFKSGEVKNNAIKISNYQFNSIDELYEDLENTPEFLLKLQRKKQQLLNLKDVANITIPKQLKATLRPYQKEGLNWLAFLEENELGGCLADDMGLGKTLQVIAFLAYLKIVKKEKLSHLVVVPTSLIFNWESEIQKFCPSLKVLVYTGLNRKEKIKSFAKANIILTTYGSILNDIETLKEIKFGYVILDESQAIKNPNSKRYKAVRMLQSKNRLALTGTPIENNTFDLYAQMNFLNPGLLGTISHFKKEFSEAIDKFKNEEASKLLSKMIHPFLLRRTKKQVATELPEKTENILYCEMGMEQRKVYNLFKDKYRDYLLNKIDENGIGKSQMYVLEGLTKLRQICNSPELLSDEEDYGKSSVKLDILIENIISKTTNHKVLVFSQFTTMLQLIKDRLDNENIAYEYLDGKTQKRQDKVANFQETENLRVFLISLKAGGVGLNLTAADYVFLVDPWWNPAVENQAIDRSYRIGQTKHVMAYKMICKDTIEEKIVDLQKNKRKVSDSLIQVDVAKKSFNKKEIKALFS
ncbi:DEAD/DEAH box helicase [Polaribacter cellanae]|uniref:DEAD/DEAH box helicase family protein n=1 Tax=Polaribacter cellanae TaxID=2818493 RepID=A0A975CLD0_9FLAO|nr:DEAD/DEAH box helicase [Polaribacter cellanae]QTE21355.1 DEAD/DEAH box helicase family protein [Polaribacter cellanae]